MYEHPLTAEHIRIVKEVLKYEVVGPVGKVLACGDIGEWDFTGFDPLNRCPNDGLIALRMHRDGRDD